MPTDQDIGHSEVGTSTTINTITQDSASEPVIALHCSGAGPSQWRELGEMLRPDFALVAPEHYGCASVGHWTGQHVFSLADEAKRSIALIDGSDRNVHLIGHSYGGGVALHVAQARSDRIASLTLYEPSAFYLLKQFDEGAAPFEEIKAIADAATSGLATGNYHEAARTFIDYWRGSGSWHDLRPDVRDALIRWLPKVPLDFTALFNELTPWSAYAAMSFPVLIIRGEHAPAPTKLIADMLSSTFPNARREVIAGAGHMGPLTHTPEVNALIVAHIVAHAVCSSELSAKPQI